METLERLAWQLSVTLTRQQLPAAAEAFLAKVRERLFALSNDDPAQPGGTSLKFRATAASALLALALAALKRCWGTRGKSERPSFATGKRLRLGVVLALAVGCTAAQEGSQSRSLSPIHEPEMGHELNDFLAGAAIEPAAAAHILEVNPEGPAHAHGPVVGAQLEAQAPANETEGESDTATSPVYASSGTPSHAYSPVPGPDTDLESAANALPTAAQNLEISSEAPAPHHDTDVEMLDEQELGSAGLGAGPADGPAAAVAEETPAWIAQEARGTGATAPKLRQALTTQEQAMLDEALAAMADDLETRAEEQELWTWSAPC